MTLQEASDVRILWIPPKEADPAVENFLAPNCVALPRTPRLDIAPIVLLPGANRVPSDELLLVETLARKGCRVIGLTYNNGPSIRSTCPTSPDPDCSAKLREMRIFGTGDASGSVAPVETLASRLAAVIRTLDRRCPLEGWHAYTDWPEPAWHLLTLGGHLQGGGMAAFVAKRRTVGRVAIFSNPADFHLSGPSSRPELAPWVGDPGVTPVERQFALYHRREEAAVLIAASLTAMKLPASHIRAVDLDLPVDAAEGTTFHQIVTRDRRYEASWSWLFGLDGSIGANG